MRIETAVDGIPKSWKVKIFVPSVLNDALVTPGFGKAVKDVSLNVRQSKEHKEFELSKTQLEEAALVLKASPADDKLTCIG